MLILTRKRNQRIMIGKDIIITIKEIRDGHQVHIGIEAPRQIPVDREEVYLRKQAEKNAETIDRQLVDSCGGCGAEYSVLDGHVCD